MVLRCNKHLLDLGRVIKRSLVSAGLIGYQFGTVGVSDGISMGTRGMSYSLQSRDLIADQVETAAGGHWLDGMVVVPGCDKNMPGVLIACEFLPFVYGGPYNCEIVGRLNRPGLMVYGGTIRPAHVAERRSTSSPLSNPMVNTSKTAKLPKQNKNATILFEIHVPVLGLVAG